jgi:hypothetical protein
VREQILKQHSESNAATNNVYPVVKIFFLCIAASLFLFVFILAVWNFYQLAVFDKTTAVIASINTTQTTGKTAATFFEYSVSFQTPKNTIYTNAGKTVFYQAFSKGERVTVYYDPQNPFTAFINSFSTIWFMPMVLFLLGAFMLILSKPRFKDLNIIYRKLLG